jgi:hypothetical protein
MNPLQLGSTLIFCLPIPEYGIYDSNTLCLLKVVFAHGSVGYATYLISVTLYLSSTNGVVLYIYSTKRNVYTICKAVDRDVVVVLLF